MAVSEKTDYVAEAQQLVRQAHRNKPNTQALIAGLMLPCQAAESAIQSLVGPYDLASSSGDRLAQIGSIFGLTQAGLPDESFRLLILGAIAQRHCKGTLTDVLLVAKTLYQASRVSADSPLSAGSGAARSGGSLRITIGGAALPQSLWPTAHKLVAACVPAGVYLDDIVSYAASHVFAFAGPGDYVGGFGSTKDTTVGAPLASASAA